MRRYVDQSEWINFPIDFYRQEDVIVAWRSTKTGLKQFPNLHWQNEYRVDPIRFLCNIIATHWIH